MMSVASATSCLAFSSVTLAWDRSPDPTVTGYYLYYGGRSGTYTNRLSAGSTSNTVPNLTSGVTYYFVVTAYTAAGLESDPSNEVGYTVPMPAPRITNAHRLPTGNFSVAGTGGPSQTCVLQAASSLGAPVVWTSISTNVADANGLFSCSDLRATNYAKRFYRIQVR